MNWLQGVDLSVFQTGLPTMVMVGWLAWHLNGKFNRIEKDLRILLEEHEKKDQSRHIENLSRFTQLEVGQARLGLMNGYYAPKETIRETATEA